MPSTIIRTYEYDPVGHELKITLVTGRVYVYFQVPQAIYNDFSTAFSKGRFYNKHIRGAYEFREVTPVS